MKSRMIWLRVQPRNQVGRWTHIRITGRSMAASYYAITAALAVQDGLVCQQRCANGWKLAEPLVVPVYTKR